MHVMHSLQYYFEKVDQVQPREHLCDRDYPWEQYLYAPQRLYDDNSTRNGRAIDYVNGVRLAEDGAV